MALLAKYVALRWCFPGVAWAELTPREALTRSKKLKGVLTVGVASVYVLAHRIGAGLFFAGVILFLVGYLPLRFGPR